MQATQNNISNARNWMLNMGNAASELGLTIQYCMPLPLHLLQVPFLAGKFFLPFSRSKFSL